MWCIGETRGRRYGWLAGLALILFLPLLAACDRSQTPEVTPTARPLVVQTPTSTRVVPTPPPPSPTPLAMPPAAVPTVVSQPTPLPTPFPDAQEIVTTVLGTEAGKHWASYTTRGSITARRADEQVALVGNMGDDNEVRWVVVGRYTDFGTEPRMEEEGWQLLGTSEWLGSGFDAPPSYLPPELLDFDGDGRREMLSQYVSTEGGWQTAADTLYRWDGQGLVSVWGTPTLVDNRMADSRDVPQPYREAYEAEWEWVEMDGRGVDEILLREHVAFYLPGEDGRVPDDAPSIGEEAGERAFRWDGEAFRPYAPRGPSATFAYATADDLWLWQGYTARPLGVGPAQEIYWSPDGGRLAWWAPVGAGGAAQGAVLGVYDLASETWQAFSLAGAPAAVRWTPEGRLVYVLPGQWPALLDFRTGQQQQFPVASLGAWSPDRNRMAYVQDGSLRLYDFAAGQDRVLVLAPARADTVRLAVLPDVAWSPRGDWIACRLAGPDLTWVGLVAPDLARPLSALDLLDTFDGLQAAGLQFAWSPAGSYLAALASDPRAGQQPAILYLADMFSRRDELVGHPERQEVLRLGPLTQTVGLAWSPDERRLAVAAGAEVWEVSTLGEATLRRRFSFPDVRWKALQWAPDGSGFVAALESAYDGRLYWFPADGGEPDLLLVGALGTLRWAPRAVEVPAGPVSQPSMVLVEHVGDKSVIHFVGADGSDRLVRAAGADRYTPFQLGGSRAYYYTYYADPDGVRSLASSGALGGCHPPLASADGELLAWLCDNGLPDLSAMISGTAEIQFRLMVTDGQGRQPREAWSYVEKGPDYRSVHVLNWRADGNVVYMARPRYGAAWAYFGYNPGILALDVNSGEVTPVGDAEGIHDGRVSSDGTWLVQSRFPESPEERASIVLRFLVDGTEREVACAEGAAAAGDFSFSPENAWLAWREWGTGPAGAKLLIRAMRMPDGEPFTVYEDAEAAAPGIGGWLARDDLVMVYPVLEDGTGGYSTVLTLPASGPGSFLSPYSFLGTWSGTP